MTFYVFYSKSRQRIRVHKAECKHCNHGKGHEYQEKGGTGVTGWMGPYSTLEDTDKVMDAFGPSNRGHCYVCLRV